MNDLAPEPRFLDDRLAHGATATPDRDLRAPYWAGRDRQTV